MFQSRFLFQIIFLLHNKLSTKCVNYDHPGEYSPEKDYHLKQSFSGLTHPDDHNLRTYGFKPFTVLYFHPFSSPCKWVLATYCLG